MNMIGLFSLGRRFGMVRNGFLGLGRCFGQGKVAGVRWDLAGGVAGSAKRKLWDGSRWSSCLSPSLSLLGVIAGAGASWSGQW